MVRLTRIFPRKSLLSFSVLLLLSALVCSEARGEERPKFKIETLPADKASAPSKMWGVARTIKIVEPMSLSNSCERVEGEVAFRRRGTEIFVKLRPRQNDLPAEGCTQGETPVTVTVTIPNMPFIPGCMHHIWLETPQGIVNDTVILNW